MSNQNIITNYWFSIALSLIIGILLALIFQNFWLPALAFGFAFTREIISYFRDRAIKLNETTDKLTILKRFAQDKLGQTRIIINQKKIKSIIHCFIALEFISTEISKCCDDCSKSKFRKVKGLISDTKTTFDKSRYDKNIDKPYDDAITAINNLETYLTDL